MKFLDIYKSLFYNFIHFFSLHLKLDYIKLLIPDQI